MNDRMEEAYYIAKEWLKEINHCVEYENAWCFEDTDWIEFTRHLGERTGGCSGTCYVMKNDGRLIVSDLFDVEEMCRLYEKFILEYYRKEHPEITANASRIPWQLDDDTNDMLPVMQTDIMLTQEERILIIDAKYYSHSTQLQFDTHTLHSGNMYQIFTYVKNKEAEMSGKPHTVSGMLLYAKTDEKIYPNNEYSMSGNRIAVRTLDLSGDFESIRSQLDAIVCRVAESR